MEISQNTPKNTANTQIQQPLASNNVETHPDAWKFQQLYQATWWDWNKVINDSNFSKLAEQAPDKVKQLKQYFDNQNNNQNNVASLITKDKFWVWTTPEYRQQRNEELVNAFIKQWNFDYATVYNEVQAHQVWASNYDVVNTVNTLQQMYLKKKKELEAQTTLTTPAKDLAQQPLTPDQKQVLQQEAPQKLQEVQQLRDYQNLQNLYAQTKDPQFEKFIQDSYTNLLKATVKVPNLQKEYNDLVASNWLWEVGTKLTEAKKNMQEIRDTMDHTLKDVEKEFAGTWATSSFIRREAQKRLEDLQEQYKVAARTYDEYAWQYKQIQDNIQNQLTLKEKQYSYLQQQQQVAFQRLWIINNLYEQQVKEKQAILDRFLNERDRREAQQEVLNTFKQETDYRLATQYWDIHSKNPLLRKIAVENAVQETMDQFKGWTFQRSKATIVNDVQKLVNKGMSLWDAIKQNITDKLHSNPQFNLWASQQISTTSNYKPVVTKIWWTWYYYTNWKWEQINPKVEQTLSILNQYKDWTKWWQCWTFVNNVLQAEWYGRLFWSSLESKKKLINSHTPEVWDVVIMSSSKYPKYWHVAIVQKINDDWSIVVKESNWTWNELIGTRTIHNTWSILWYFNPQNQVNINQVYTPAEIRKYNTMPPSQYWKLPQEERQKVDNYLDWKQKVFDSSNTSVLEKLQLSVWWKWLTKGQVHKVNTYQTAFNDISALQNAINKLAAEWKTWPLAWKITEKNLWDKNVKLINAISTATIPTVARWIYWEVWVLTDADYDHYKQTIPNIQNTKAQNRAIYEMNLHILRNGMINEFENLAKSWYDVSKFKTTIKNLNDRINQERAKINIELKKEWLPLLKPLSLKWVVGMSDNLKTQIVSNSPKIKWLEPETKWWEITTKLNKYNVNEWINDWLKTFRAWKISNNNNIWSGDIYNKWVSFILWNK